MIDAHQTDGFVTELPSRVRERLRTPHRPVLEQNFPNPFNAETSIETRRQRKVLCGAGGL